MSREDGIKASNDILSIIKTLSLNEGITCLVFILSYIYATHEITKPIEDCANEIKEEFLKNYKNFEDKTPPIPTAKIEDNENKDERENSWKDFDRIYDELNLIIRNENVDCSLLALQAFLAYFIGKNYPDNYEEVIKFMFDKITNTIKEAEAKKIDSFIKAIKTPVSNQMMEEKNG